MKQTVTEQTWECPLCQTTIEWSYANLADGGSPYCPKCEADMDWKGQEAPGQ